jgi:hypothetical protein
MCAGGVSQWADVACECLAKDGKMGAAEANRVWRAKEQGSGECAALAGFEVTAGVAMPKTAVPTTVISLEAALDSDSTQYRKSTLGWC